jgi:hypothetical protein
MEAAMQDFGRMTRKWREVQPCCSKPLFIIGFSGQYDE